MTKTSLDRPTGTDASADPLTDAARALLAAIEAEPVPQHLVDLVLSLKAALDGHKTSVGGKG